MPRSILVVSDDAELEEEMRFGLTDKAEIICTADALSARDVFAANTPIAVVVDLRTGNAGGFALARDMSQDPRLRDIPIVILIGREQDRWLASEAGAAAILRKPVTAAQLNSTLGPFLTSEVPA